MKNEIMITPVLEDAIRMMATKKINYHISKLLDGNRVVNDATKKAVKIDGIALLDSGDTVGLVSDKVFSLGRLYVDKADKALHWSTLCVAGTINARNTTLEDAIQRYNNDLMYAFKTTDLPTSGFIISYVLF